MSRVAITAAVLGTSSGARPDGVSPADRCSPSVPRSSALCAAFGFTLIELLVAVALLASLALALGGTLIAAQRARAVSEQWMQATLLAVEGIEQLRARHALGVLPPGSVFARRGVVAPWGTTAGIWRLDVTVTWADSRSEQLQVSTLAVW